MLNKCVAAFYGRLGYYNHIRKKTDTAERYYEKALAYNPESRFVLIPYGLMLLKKGQFEQAKDYFERVLNQKIKQKIKIAAKINLALSYWKLNMLDSAVNILNEVHEKFKCTTVYGTLGYILIEKGDLDKAYEYNMEALEYDEEDPVILDNIGQLYYRKGNLEKAEEYFLKAVDKRGDLADTLYYLGCIYKEKGKLDDGEEKLEKALNCNITPLNTVTREDIENKLNEIKEGSNQAMM